MSSSAIDQQLKELKETSAFISMATRHSDERTTLLCTKQWARKAALLIFCNPLPAECLLLLHLSGQEWRKLLDWLDISGLALYFLDRIIELQLYDSLPSSVVERLQQNLTCNIQRTNGLIEESAAIQQQFQAAHLSYALLKGFSLCPHSVPRPELRHQFDLDFLLAEQDAPQARQILEFRGYCLYAISGRSWEFKLNEPPGFSLKNLYRDLPCRSVELHIEANVPGQRLLLDSIEQHEFHGISMPTLLPVDLFLGQGLHAYKHVCSESSRTSHLLEFRRHVLNRRDDQTFWRELQFTAENSPRAYLGLGVVTLLITRTMGDFAPEALTGWTVERLPQSARMWVEMFGSRAVYENFPGSKLYLLLQKELESAGVPTKRSLREALLPTRLPPAVVKASVNQSLSARFRRYRRQLHFILFRLRFHIVEGLRYTLESYRWRHRMERLPE